MSGAGTVLGGRYELVEKIGGGAMGSVWRAEDTVLARRVAVKILRSELLEDDTSAQRFRREAQLVAAVDHPGVVGVHDYGESRGNGEERCAYIVMELIDGRPLDKVLKDTGPMAVGRTLDLVAGALDALHAAHRREIVHRDIKPSNLMVRADGRVAVTDFGIARAVASTKLTAPFAIIGTALYMSPEQAEGAELGPATDLYSIGVVCYELLVGKPPYSGDGPLQIALKHVNQPVPELPDTFPAPVRVLVARALAKKPEERYADAAAMAAAARAARAALAGEGGPGEGAAREGSAVESAAGAGAGAGESEGERGEGGTRGAGGAQASGKAGAADSRTVPLRPGAGAEAAGAAVELVKGAAKEPFGGGAVADPAGAGAPVRPASGGAPVADEVARVEPQAPTETGRKRSRRTLLVPVVIPVVISMGTATVLLVDRGAGGSDAALPPAAQPTVVVTAPANPGTATAAPTATPTGASATPAPTDTPAASPGPDQSAPGAVQGQPQVPAPPVPAAGQGGSGGQGVSSGGRTGGTGTAAGGSSAGQASQPGGGNPPNPPANQNPQPPAQTTGGGTTSAPQNPSRPASCDGTSWSTIVSVKDGRTIGMRDDNLNGDNPIVVGGHAQYGWVRSTNPGAWILFNACNNGGPQMVQTMDGKVVLSGGFSFLTNWTVRSGSSAGSYTLGDYQNQSCMTNNGPGGAVTMVACTPGNTAQEWRLQ
ncbi:protein kinase [Kitasatospora sp. NPDC058444]|uniref:serine/threonine-protein kinase n=1 Tax=Kitasatospora sp. NPDC058444 TaxID=3346504 RepID=UPI00365AA9E2